MKRFLELSRAPFFTAVLAPVLLGIAVAYKVHGSVDWLLAVLTVIGAVAAHASANLFNDYYDYKLGADTNNRFRNKFSGGSPHIVEGKERANTFFMLGVISSVVAAASGIAILFFMQGNAWVVIALAVAGFLLGFFYTAPPLKLAYRGLGEVAIFVAFGVLPVVGAYYVQTGTLDTAPFLASLPLAMLITNIIWINEFPDYEADSRAGKRNLVVRLGTKSARYGYYIFVALAAAFMIWLAVDKTFGVWILIALFGLIPAVIAARMLHSKFASPPELLPAQGLTIVAHLATAILMVVAVVISALV